MYLIFYHLTSKSHRPSATGTCRIKTPDCTIGYFEDVVSVTVISVKRWATVVVIEMSAQVLTVWTGTGKVSRVEAVLPFLLGDCSSTGLCWCRTNDLGTLVTVYL